MGFWSGLNAMEVGESMRGFRGYLKFVKDLRLGSDLKLERDLRLRRILRLKKF
jgi:hypothetical protein